MSGAHFRLKHSCLKSGRTYSPEWRRPKVCRACVADVPLERMPLVTPSPTHWARHAESAQCGVLRPVRRAWQDRQVTCVPCLLVRLASLGMPVPMRVLSKTTHDADSQVALLRRAVKNALRMRAWLAKRSA